MLKCSSVDEWNKKMWYIYNIEYYAARKKDILSFETACRNILTQSYIKWISFWLNMSLFKSWIVLPLEKPELLITQNNQRLYDF